MIKTLFERLTCRHNWRKTYDGSYIPSQFACDKCGKAENVWYHDEGSWRIRRQLKGDTFE